MESRLTRWVPEITALSTSSSSSSFVCFTPSDHTAHQWWTQQPPAHHNNKQKIPHKCQQKKNMTALQCRNSIETYFELNLSHQRVLSDKKSQKNQWKTGHHFQVVAVGKLMAFELVAPTTTWSVAVPAAQANSAPHNYKGHRHECILCPHNND